MATEKRLIYLEDAVARIVDTPSDVATMAFEGYYGFIKNPANILVDRQHEILDLLEAVPTVDAVPVSAEELRHLINDTLAYIWKMESDGREYLTESRKTLLEKLKRFEKEHFTEIACSCGERKDND